MRRAVILLALLAAARCASMGPVEGGPPGPPSSADAEELDRARAALAKHDRKLTALEAETAAPDCGRTCQLRGNVCELAARICAIAERHPGDAETEQLCRDGRARCARATALARARCLGCG